MTVRLSEIATKQLKRLDKTPRLRIISFLHELESLADPRSKGKGLTENLSGFWRYQVGDYRIICEIKDRELIIEALYLGHRRDIYR